LGRSATEKKSSRNESAGGRSGSVGIATHYGLGGPLFRERWGRNLAYPSTLAPWATEPPVQQAPVLISGVKAAGALCKQATPSSAEVKKMVDLYRYFTFCGFMACYGTTLPLPLT
jgi:hypothetical protein